MARWGLFLAALLHFGVAVVGPYWHLGPLERSTRALAGPQGGEEPATPEPRHSEQACIVCQTAASTGAVPQESILPLGDIVPVRDVAEPSVSLPHILDPALQARAPPLA